MCALDFCKFMRPYLHSGLAPGIALLAMALVSGCNSKSQPTMKVVEGTVSFDGEPVTEGSVRFVPIEDTQGPTSIGAIADGQYRVEARGGVPIGKHRVEVEAWKRTGRKVLTKGRFEPTEEVERVRMGPESYAGAKSPLIYELTPGSDGHFDVKLLKN